MRNYFPIIICFSGVFYIFFLLGIYPLSVLSNEVGDFVTTENLSEDVIRRFENQTQPIEDEILQQKQTIDEKMVHLQEEYLTRTQLIDDEQLKNVIGKYYTQIDIVLGYLIELEDDIALNEGLTKEEKNNATMEINTYMIKILEMKGMMVKSDSRNVFQAHAEQIRLLWNEILELINKYLGLDVSGEYESILMRLEPMIRTLRKKISELAFADQQDALDKLDKIQVGINEVRESMLQVKVQFLSIVPGSGNVELISESTGEILATSKFRLFEISEAMSQVILSL